MSDVRRTLDELANRHVTLHGKKEDRFWVAKMGLADDAALASRELAEAEVEMNRFLQDPERLASLKALAASGRATPEEARTLAGWIALFSAHVIEKAEARALSEEIVHLESALASARGGMKLGYTDPASGAFVPASSVKLALVMRTDPDEANRKAAYEGLRSIEPFVLSAGFLEIVKKRNRLGRLLGYEDYYDWRVQVVERMSKKRLFEVLDDLSARTKDRMAAELDAFEAKHGAAARKPWNFVYLRSGDLSRAIDPYFGFGAAFARWGRSFTALGVRYRGATLTLDLVDRKGKYENGFMHGPGLAFFDHGAWRPARINFTANAVPGQVGSGLRATETFFHEGGHAAHFANILMDAPCFSQEFAPTSVAYAETQSMFMDSLLGDADWRTRYARDASGAPMPLSLIERAIREEQPLRGFDVRALLTIPLAERALYELPDDELTPERVLETFRRIERETQQLEAGVRPVLAVPHLLAGESSAYYHGYVLAEMAVYATRAHFLARDGHLTDNPRIGPELAEAYWSPGNSVGFDETLRRLTGKPLSADALVAECNATVEESLEEAREAAARAASTPAFTGPVELDAEIRVIHGRELVASTKDDGFEGAARKFEAFVGRLSAT